MERSGAERAYGLLHEERPYHNGSFTSWAEKPSRSHPYHHDDGVTVWVSPTDLTPGDKFLSEELAPPAGVGFEEPRDPGDRANGPGA